MKLNETVDKIDENQINRWVKHASKKKNTNEIKSIADLVQSYKKRQKSITKPSNLLLPLEKYICKMIYGDEKEKDSIVNERYQKDYAHYCTYINSLLLRIAINGEMVKDIKKFVISAEQDKKDAIEKLKTAKKSNEISKLKKSKSDSTRCITISKKQMDELEQTNILLKSMVKKLALNGCYICRNYMYIYSVASMGQHIPKCLKKSK